jgi:two-component system, sensor histidine kinase YesM
MKGFRFSKLNLQGKLLLLYFLTIFVPLLVTGQIILSISGKKIIEQTTSITQEASQQTAKNIQVLLNQYVDIVNRLSFDQQLNNYLNPSRIYESDLESIDAYSLYLKPVTYYDFNFKEPTAKLKIYFLNTTLLQDSNTFIFADQGKQNLAEYRASVIAGGELVWGKDGERIYIARSMYNMQKKLEAVVSIEIPESRLNALIMEREKSDNMMFITEASGSVISTNTKEFAGLTIKDKPFFKPGEQLPFDVTDEEMGTRYKVVEETLGNGRYYPDWHLFTLIPLDRLINDEQKIRRTGLLVSSLGLIISCGIFMLSLTRITSRIKALVHKMRIVRTGELTLMEDHGPTDEVGVLTQNFNEMILDLKRSIYDNYEVNLKLKDITIKKQEAELYALQNQINPHFLFNTLESIRMGLHNKGDDETAVIVLNLSKLFQNLLNWQGEFIPLREEIELVNKYLSIQKYRFQDKIQYQTLLPESLKEVYIPKLTIQPVVENAVKHGIEGIRGQGNIMVRAEEAENGTMRIVVEDDGAGIPLDTLQRIQQELESPEIKKSGSIGLKNVHDRIVLHSGSAYGVTIESKGGSGTRVVISMPVLLHHPVREGANDNYV